MKQYYELMNSQTLEVYINGLKDRQPANSIVLTDKNSSFFKPVFDRYPDPTSVIEGASFDEISERNKTAINSIREHYSQLLAKTDWYEIRELARGIPVPQDVADERARLIADANEEISAINGEQMKSIK